MFTGRSQLIAGIIHVQRTALQSEIFCHRRGIFPAELYQIVFRIAVFRVPGMIHMAVFQNGGRNIPGGGLTDNAVVVLSIAFQSCFNSAEKQSPVSQRSQKLTAELIAVAVIGRKCGYPDFRSEKLMIL